MTMAGKWKWKSNCQKRQNYSQGLRPPQNVGPTLRREIVHWDFSSPLLVSQATSHAQPQLLNMSAVTATDTCMPNFEKTLTFFELMRCRCLVRQIPRGHCLRPCSKALFSTSYTKVHISVDTSGPPKEDGIKSIAS